MRAVLLAAGRARRLRPLADRMPKPMVSVGGSPLIEHQLAWLAGGGFDEVAINLHHAPGPLMAYVGDGGAFGVRVTYAHEDRLLGTAGSVRSLRDFLGASDPFLVLYGDMVTDLSLPGLLTSHAASGAEMTVCVTAADDRADAGWVVCDPDSWIVDFIEKPVDGARISRWRNTGIYACSTRLLERLQPMTPPLDFGLEVLPALAATGRLLRAHPVTNVAIDIGTPEGLASAFEAIRRGAVRLHRRPPIMPAAAAHAG